ncbi:uncharacterized protein EDB93DRAFT_1257058 [Suillus bovinus]|uniref:uncharacterized protein n=1 Tax=Suillus bovinus TaxID=48563 RepID=UPI001B870D36|nr:uncharacterized protein EDB93DRAFT_1257058 [Suillus bovinus]KAG2127299.1 hypothetical protein EDB93DRAFT_1257058 [Suillus bovinus]
MIMTLRFACHLDRQDKLWRFGIATMLKCGVLDPDPEELPMDEGDDEDIAELEEVSTDQQTALLEGLNHMRANTNYFIKAKEVATVPRGPSTHPPRMFTAGNTAIHLNYSPTRTGMKIDDVADEFNILDLCDAISNFLRLDTRNRDVIHGVGISRRSLIDRPSTLPFDHVQAHSSLASFMSSRQSEIDNFLLYATISSVGVPSGPHTLDTTQALLKQELKNRLIHEGIGKGARIPLDKSIFHHLVRKTTLQLSEIKTIQYDKTGPSAYSGDKWKFHRRRKGIKRTCGAKDEQDDGTEDSGTEHEDTEDPDTDSDDEDAEDYDTDSDGTDIVDAEVKGAVLGVEPSLTQ